MKKFFAIEGMNGSGKTTTATMVFESLRDEGYNVDFVRLPRVGTTFREILNSDLKSDSAKLFTFLADIAEFYENTKPDTIYLLDRSSISTIVYQSASGFDIEFIKRCLKETKEQVDFCFLLDCEPVIARKRRMNSQKDAGNPGKFAFNSLEYYTKIREKYLETVKNEFPASHSIYRTDIHNQNLISQRIVREIKSLLS